MLQPGRPQPPYVEDGEHDAAALLAAFEEWLAARGIGLMPLQCEFAHTVIDNRALWTFMRGGRGSGRTFIAELMELFAEDQP